MTQAHTPLRHPFARFARCEAGTATMNFVLMLPVVFGMFLMTLDTGFSTMRAALLERALDVTARSVRTGGLANPTLANIRADICSRMTFFADCGTQLKVQIVAVSRPGFATPARNIACADQGAALAPVRSFTAGQSNPLAVLRACMDVTSITPAAILSNRPFTYRIHAATVLAGRAT